jgi:hypothetical protein
LLVIGKRQPSVLVHAAAFAVVMIGADLGRTFWVGPTEAALI